MSDVLRELSDELAELGCDEVETALVLREAAGLRDLVPGPASAPTPSDELAALLGRGTVPAPPQRWQRDRRDRRAVGRSGAAGAALVALVSGVGATGLSAAANTLPAPVQERVASFSRSWLPFDLPHPDERRGSPGGEVGDLFGDPLGAPVDRSPGGAAAEHHQHAPAATEQPAVRPVPAGRPEAGTGRPAAVPEPAEAPAGPAASTTVGGDAPPSASPGSTSAGPTSSGPGDGPTTTTGPGKAKGAGTSKGSMTSKGSVTSKGSGTSREPRGSKPLVLATTSSTPDVPGLADEPAADDQSWTSPPSAGPSLGSATDSAGSEDLSPDDEHPGRHLGLDKNLDRGQGRGQQEAP